MTAQRLNSIAPFHAMALLARARELEARGRAIVHMEIGEPDFATPQPVVDAGIRALQQGKTHYTPAVGLRELREAIADHYLRQFGERIDPRRILVTPGASGALQLILAMLVDPGSQVLMTDPGYPCNRNFVLLFEGEPVMIPVDAEQHYQPDADLLEHYWSERTSCVMVASPSNPPEPFFLPANWIHCCRGCVTEVGTCLSTKFIRICGTRRGRRRRSRWARTCLS
jgi:aspartate/methionine/tyrosine aminotransferase